MKIPGFNLRIWFPLRVKMANRVMWMVCRYRALGSVHICHLLPPEVSSHLGSHPLPCQYVIRRFRPTLTMVFKERFMVLSASYKELYDKQGYVVIPGLVPGGVLLELTAAAERTIERTRSGSWTCRRTVGRQFPPFDDANPDSWGVQHIMHPDLGEPAFARWYTSDIFVETVKELLDCQEDELQMGRHTNECAGTRCLTCV